MSEGVVGVTGHRAEGLAGVERAALERRVDRVLAALARLGHTRLVSGLAEGADRIVAWRALAAGWRLEALLPIAPERYEADFANAASRAEFGALVGRADDVRVAGAPPEHDGAPPYAVQGRALVARSAVVIALWDGAPPRGPGGTADVVRWAGEGGVPVVWIDARPPHRVRLLPEGAAAIPSLRRLATELSSPGQPRTDGGG